VFFGGARGSWVVYVGNAEVCVESATKCPYLLRIDAGLRLRKIPGTGILEKRTMLCLT